MFTPPVCRCLPSADTSARSPVPVQLVSLSRPVTVEEGDSRTLACRYVGLPPPSLTWYRDGQPLDESRSVGSHGMAWYRDDQPLDEPRSVGSHSLTWYGDGQPLDEPRSVGSHRMTWYRRRPATGRAQVSGVTQDDLVPGRSSRWTSPGQWGHTGWPGTGTASHWTSPGQ